jgi:hypothetical protein
VSRRILDNRRAGVGSQINLRDDGTCEVIVTCRYQQTLLAHGDLIPQPQTLQLWVELGLQLVQHASAEKLRELIAAISALPQLAVTPQGADSAGPAVPGAPQYAEHEHPPQSQPVLLADAPAAAAADLHAPGAAAAVAYSAPGELQVHASADVGRQQQPVTLGGHVYQPLPDSENPFMGDPDAPLSDDELRELGVLHE